MKKLLSAVCLLSLASTLTLAQEYYRPRTDLRSHPRQQSYPQPQRQQSYPQPQRPYVCNAEWKPVCARTRQNIVARYSNSCFAEQDGALVIGGPEECELITCAAIYEPVCARIIIDQGSGDELIDRETAKKRRPELLIYKNKAFFNACAAQEISKATVLTTYSEGRPRYSEHRHIRGAVDFNSVCPTTCSGRVELVCGRDDQGKERLYANRCSAILEGALFLHPGVCAGRYDASRREDEPPWREREIEPRRRR